MCGSCLCGNVTDKLEEFHIHGQNDDIFCTFPCKKNTPMPEPCSSVAGFPFCSTHFLTDLAMREVCGLSTKEWKMPWEPFGLNTPVTVAMKRINCTALQKKRFRWCWFMNDATVSTSNCPSTQLLDRPTHCICIQTDNSRN